MTQRVLLLGLACLALALAVTQAAAQQVQVQEHVLDNGMKLLMVPRKGDPNVAAGWVARVGSVNERPGITGISHLFEHMMFKGTTHHRHHEHRRRPALMAQMDEVKAQIRAEEQEQLRRCAWARSPICNDPKTPHAAAPAAARRAGRARARQQKDLIVKNEFDQVYTTAGASGMNAGTVQGLHRVFHQRPGQQARAVVLDGVGPPAQPGVPRVLLRARRRPRGAPAADREHADRASSRRSSRRCSGSASPYHWPVVGWPSDLEEITREEALAYFDLNYAPNNLTACLVGDFDPQRASAAGEQVLRAAEAQPAGAPSPCARARSSRRPSSG